MARDTQTSSMDEAQPVDEAPLAGPEGAPVFPEVDATDESPGEVVLSDDGLGEGGEPSENDEAPARKKPSVRKGGAKSTGKRNAKPEGGRPAAGSSRVAPVQTEPVIIDGVRLKPAHRLRWRSVVKWTAIICGIVVAMALCVFLVFRWGFSRDSELIQGQWRIDGSNVEIAITEDRIVLSDDLAFRYELDPFAKTITFFFSDLEGGGHYRFSMDGNRLAIRDGQFGPVDTLIGDIPFSLGTLIDTLMGVAPPLFGAESDVTNLTRVGGDEPAAPSAPETSQESPAPEAAPAPVPETPAEEAPEPDDEAPEPTPPADDGSSEGAAEEDQPTAPEPLESLGQVPEDEAGTGAV